MKKAVFLLGAFFLFSTCLFAQDSPKFSGIWKLDKDKSTLDPLARIESMTLKVTQTDKDLTIETATTRESSTDGKPVMISGGNGITVYGLDGKENTVEEESFRGKIPVTRKAEITPRGKISLSSSRMGVFNNVEALTTVKDFWELSNDGKILTITRTSSTPRGEMKTQMVFTKN